MSDRRPLMNDDELLLVFADLLDQVPLQTQDEVDTVLLEAGLDPDEIASEARQLVREGLAESPLNWRNKREMLDDERKKLAGQTPLSPSSPSSLREAIHRLLPETIPQPAGVYFRDRDLEEVSREDLESLYKELRFLEDHE